MQLLFVNQSVLAEKVLLNLSAALLHLVLVLLL
jgi:hypothetical protein